MALEAADIQDSAIMAMSKQETNDKGKMQFSASLPSGREIHSEFFDPGRKRDALLAWLPAVRSAILSDDEEARAQAKQNAALAQQAKDVPAARPLIVDARGERPEKAPNPADYVKRMVDGAQLEFDRCVAASNDAFIRLKDAEKALAVWKTIEQSIVSQETPECQK